MAKPIWLDNWERIGCLLRGRDRYRKSLVTIAVVFQSCHIRQTDKKPFYVYWCVDGRKYILGHPGRGFITKS